MGIQIFGKSKCFATQKAKRWFKERRIPVQEIDLLRYGMSAGELTSVVRAVGLDALVDWNAPGAETLKYLAYDADKLEKLLDEPKLIRTPVVRCGREAAVGEDPAAWEKFAAKEKKG